MRSSTTKGAIRTRTEFGVVAFATDVWNHRRGKVGVIIVSIFLAVALLAPWLAPYDPYKFVAQPYLQPTLEHPLGTDGIGRDLLSQVLWGTRISLLIGFVVALSVIVIGSSVGLVAAYYGGIVDELLMRFTDELMVLPSLPLMIWMATMLGQSMWNTILVLAVFGWPSMARMVRSETLSLKSRPFVDAARVSGASDVKIMTQIILPNVAPLIVANGILSIVSAILGEASLSFLGLGDPFNMSWGTVLYFAQIEGAFYNNGWAWILAPGLSIAAVGLAITFIGSAVTDIANPRLRSA
jgi:ABC-type dipeptide/oligopeptide/nickel transport system permease subunit